MARQWPDSGPTAPDRARHPDSQGSRTQVLRSDTSDTLDASDTLDTPTLDTLTTSTYILLMYYFLAAYGWLPGHPGHTSAAHTPRRVPL